jgi:hypothetical protein
MWKALKPQVPPLIGFGIQILTAKWQPDWLIGLILGILAFWLAFALLSNRSIRARWPWLHEWVPFLGSIGPVMTMPDQLTAKYIVGHTFKIALIAEENAISERVFEDCHIWGPAVLCLTEIGVMHDCSIEGPEEAALILIVQDQVKGPINVIGCVFRRCSFHGVGFAGPKRQIDKMRTEFVPDPLKPKGLTAPPHPSEPSTSTASPQ